MRNLILGTISLYQKLISPMLPPRCRFYPSCSHYAAESVRVHGAAKGSWLSVKRIVKCHPFNEGGVDLVPEPDSSSLYRHNRTLINGDKTHG